MLTLFLARKRFMSADHGRLSPRLEPVPDKIQAILDGTGRSAASPKVRRTREPALPGGHNYPTAWAPQTQGISRIHAEGMPAAEMKHGPIASSAPGCRRLIANKGRQYEGMSNIQEVEAAVAHIAVATEGDEQIARWLRTSLHP